jgi:hypothetical protein
MRAPAGLLILALLGLTGCSTTVFESLPAGTSTDCDPAWPGRWQPVATGSDEMKPKDALEIAADCRTATVKGEAKPMRLTLVDTGKARYLQLHNDSGKPDCIGPGKLHCGAALLRYERDGDTIRLYDPDHARVAAAIKGGKIEGFSDHADTQGMKTSEPVFRNFIAGDGKRIEKLLRKHPEYFTREPLMILHRVPADAPTQTPTPEQ